MTLKLSLFIQKEKNHIQECQTEVGATISALNDLKSWYVHDSSLHFRDCDSFLFSPGFKLKAICKSLKKDDSDSDPDPEAVALAFKDTIDQLVQAMDTRLVASGDNQLSHMEFLDLRNWPAREIIGILSLPSFLK